MKILSKYCLLFLVLASYSKAQVPVNMLVNIKAKEHWVKDTFQLANGNIEVRYYSDSTRSNDLGSDIYSDKMILLDFRRRNDATKIYTHGINDDDGNSSFLSIMDSVRVVQINFYPGGGISSIKSFSVEEGTEELTIKVH